MAQHLFTVVMELKVYRVVVFFPLSCGLRTFLWDLQDIIVDFQQHVLYAFLISVLQGMAVTSEEELERLHEARDPIQWKKLA